MRPTGTESKAGANTQVQVMNGTTVSQTRGPQEYPPKKLWQPRISLIVAMDNFGESYIATSQSNTNSVTFQLFLAGLVKKLTEEKRTWR